MSSAERTSDERAQSIAYVDGLMSVEEQLAFEHKLAADPEFAARVRGLLDVDTLLREQQRELAVVGPRSTGSRTMLWVASLAAAAALLAWAAASLLTHPSAPTFDVAVAPGFESAREFAADAPELAGLVAPGLDAVRGPVEPTNVEPQRFVELARAAEWRVHREKLESNETSISAPFFVVPLTLGTPSVVVVSSIVAGAPPTRLHPADSAHAVLPAGEHVLPSERFTLTGAGDATRVRYERGFLTPIGAGEMIVVVGVRTADADATSAPTEAELAARSAEELERALREAGYATRAFTVREPR